METETSSVATENIAAREARTADVPRDGQNRLTSDGAAVAAEQGVAPQPASGGLRHDWGRAEVEAIYRMALPELVFRAQTVHRAHHAADRVQTCQLISIK